VWREKIKAERGDIPEILVGNKVDAGRYLSPFSLWISSFDQKIAHSLFEIHTGVFIAKKKSGGIGGGDTFRKGKRHAIYVRI
jgi:hypothetical protein